MKDYIKMKAAEKMKDYIKMKAAEKWSVRKQKVVDQAAISEVLDDDGNVIRSAEAEQSHEELQVVQNRFNSLTGEPLDDVVMVYSLSDVAAQRIDLADKIQSLEDEDADWAELEEDLKDL